MNSRFHNIGKATLCIAALFAGAALLTACGQQEQTSVPPTEPPVSIAPVAPGLEDDQPDWSTPTAEPTPTPTPEPATCGKVPLQEAAADDNFFSDAAFLGNSLVDGFRLYSGLKTCDVYASTSMTVLGAGELVAQMPQGTYGKVYILLGINEIGYEPDYFKEQYSALLDTIQASQPNAEIYIMSLTPVSAAKSAQGTFTMERVLAYNEKLLELAEEREMWYLDLVEALADDTGYLPANVTTDGVHFTAEEYAVWLEYLRTHYAPGSYTPASPAPESSGTPAPETT